MRTARSAALGCLMLLAISNTSQAQSSAVDHRHEQRLRGERHIVVKPAPLRATVVRVAGARLDRLPRDHVRIEHDGRSYYFHDGLFYVRSAVNAVRGFVVVEPIPGMRIASLPAASATLRINGRTLYRYRGVDYRRVNGVFVVV